MLPCEVTVLVSLLEAILNSPERRNLQLPFFVVRIHYVVAYRKGQLLLLCITKHALRNTGIWNTTPYKSWFIKINIFLRKIYFKITKRLLIPVTLEKWWLSQSQWILQFDKMPLVKTIQIIIWRKRVFLDTLIQCLTRECVFTGLFVIMTLPNYNLKYTFHQRLFSPYLLFNHY